MPVKFRFAREFIGFVADVATLAALGGAAVVAALAGGILAAHNLIPMGWLIGSASGVALLLAAGIRWLLWWLSQRFDEVGIEPYVSHKRVKLADLGTHDLTIEGRTFDDCQFVGLAMMALLSGCNIYSPTFDAPSAKDVFEPIPVNQWITGAVVFKDTTFRKCRFKRVNIVATFADVAEYEKQIESEAPK